MNIPGHPIGFPPHVRAETVPGEGVFLISERVVTLLNGEQGIALAALLDGTRDIGGVIADRPVGLAPEHVGRLLSELLAAGLLRTRQPGQLGRPDEAFWTLANLDASQSHRFPVAAITLGPGDPATLPAAVRGARLQLATGPNAAALTVVSCSDYLDPGLMQIDAAQRAAGRPWILARTTSADAWLGPVLRPGEGPCWHCLAARLQGHRLPERYLADRLGQAALPPATAHGMGQAALVNLLALEAAKWLAGYRYPGQDAICVLDTLTLQSRHHPMRRRPQCPACGDPGLVARRAAAPPISLSPRTAASADGQPAAGREPPVPAFTDFVSPVAGLIREVRPDPREPEFVSCFHAPYIPPPVPAPRLESVREAHAAAGFGKGTTAEEAETGAICEALERYSGHYQGDEPTLRASFRALGADAIHPNAVQLFHQHQFSDRSRWNQHHAPAHRVVEAFDETADIGWTPVWSLTGQRRLLPTALLYYNMPEMADRRFCRADSNGAAAGPTLAGAVLHGLYELIERDCVALWWYNMTRQPGLDLPAFGDPWVNEMCARYAGLHRQVWALDLTADLGVPVVAALSARTDKPAEDILIGFGAHLNPRIALRRAVAEINQSLPSVASACPDGSGYSCSDEWARQWWSTATQDALPYLSPAPGRALLTPADYPAVPDRDPLGDLAAINAGLSTQGLQALVLDQTRPDVGLPVAKVVVPGLRPHWARFDEGRLTEVPVRLDRLSTPTVYEDLNPVPLPV
jgi:ribosomal protein S12 methylthiotransferase accessory factor